ncbi:ATP/GTP-binding protein [Saccharopolyspora erythraea]|uniref:GTP-binding protein n=1 Tax=Saccharopolyspora erythraea TaxID=1836 RepID=UPI001BA46ED7|nr:ATP/GTP-binding protein [Saccharopolyspora erythraea]QUH03979.1 ATP/GTP-binding protein [Saccharopolyspora erythraea]
MDFARASEDVHLPTSVRRTVKLLVVGSFAVGKSTFVTTLSEIRPLHTEEIMTQAGDGIDDLAEVRGKRSTTVAMDFGRVTLADHLVLYLFGVPGQQRFTPLWDDIAHGALGALVLVDTRRLEQSFDVMDLLEERELAYAVAVNEFDGAPEFAKAELREALDLLPATPLTTCDARDQRSSTRALIAFVEYLLATHQEPV